MRRRAPGSLDCRKALEQAGGDFNKAFEFLREKGLSTALKRVDRVTSQGIVELYSHGAGRVGVMVEVNCETDFVAKTEAFRNFAHEVALQIAAAAPRYIHEEDIPADVLENEGQNAERGLEKFKDEVVLLRQPYIRDEDLTIEKLLLQTIASTGENIIIRRFARWELGESTAA